MLENISYPEGLPVKVELLNSIDYPWHMHDDMQILYVLDGELELKLTYTRYHLIRNSMHIIHSDDVHGMRSLSKQNLVVLLSLSTAYFSKFYPDLDSQIFTTKSSADVATYKKQLILKAHIFSIISEFYEKNPGYQERIIAISRDLMAALFQDFRGFFINQESRTFERKVSHDTYQSERISRIVSRVYRDYPYKPSLSDIAAEEKVNSYYLSHLFQSHVGLSFREFVSMVRVEMSESELLNTTEPISQISLNVGFSNAKYYVENFTDWFGCHPREYRRLYAEKILGKYTPVVEKLPLEQINVALEPYSSEKPIVASSGDHRIVCALDLQKVISKNISSKTVGAIHIPTISSLCNLWGDNASKLRPAVGNEPDFQQHTSDTLQRLYAPEYDHLSCLSFLKEALHCPCEVTPAIHLMDSPDATDGLLCVNGLKKPLYYLYEFWNDMFSDIVECSDHYLVTKQGMDLRILFGNGGAEKVLHYTFRFTRASIKYRVIERRISPSSSCSALWRQLDFETPLSSEIFQHIENMSAPKISFDTLPGSDGYVLEVQVMPEEVILLELSAKEFDSSKTTLP